jgi:hypothetical protein
VPGPLPEESPVCDGISILLMVIELLALTLLVTGIFANHHDVSMTTNDFAFFAHGLNTGADLHGISFISLASCPSGSPGRSLPSAYL